MALPPAHKRVQFVGSLSQVAGSGSEIFSFGWADKSALSAQALSAALAPVMQAAWSSPNQSISLYAFLDGVRVEDIGADGKVTDSYYTATQHTAGAAGGAVCTILSQAITLETSTANGKGRMIRGRFYPPAYESVYGGSCNPNDTLQYATNWASVMKGCITAGSVPAVASVDAGGVVATVTSITADNIIDTVRRRKNALVSQRTAKQSLT